MDGTHPLPRKNCQQDSSLTGQQFKIETGIVQGIKVLQQNVCIPNNITGAGGLVLYAPFTTFWMRRWLAWTGTPGTCMKLPKALRAVAITPNRPPSAYKEERNSTTSFRRRSNGMDFPCTTKLSPSTQCAVVLLFGSLSPGITNEGCSCC